VFLVWCWVVCGVFGVWGLGFGVWGEGLFLGVGKLGVGVWVLWFECRNLGLRFGVRGYGFGVRHLEHGSGGLELSYF